MVWLLLLDCQVAMTMPPPSLERQQVVIPAQGMIDVRDALTDILSEYGTSYNSGRLSQHYLEPELEMEC